MNRTKISVTFIFILCKFFIQASVPKLQAQELDRLQEVEIEKSDTVESKIFNQIEFTKFLFEQINYNKDFQAKDKINPSLKDSLQAILSKSGKIQIPANQIDLFFDFQIDEPESNQLFFQEFISPSKSTFELGEVEVEPGDNLNFKWQLNKSLGKKQFSIEFFFNGIQLGVKKWDEDKSVFDFTAEKSGKVKAIIRNRGYFSISGTFELNYKKRKKSILYQRIKSYSWEEEEQLITSNDTIFQYENIEIPELSSLNNLLGNSVYSKTFTLDEKNNLLGIAFFIFPDQIELQDLLVSPRILVENPFIDFARKEFKKTSYTYFIESEVKNLDFKIFENKSKLIWDNGKFTQTPNWELSENSKLNYGFLYLRELNTGSKIRFQLKNRSKIHKLKLQVHRVLVYEFPYTSLKKIKKEIVNEFILLTLI